jgi:hypothetical protein
MFETDCRQTIPGRDRPGGHRCMIGAVLALGLAVSIGVPTARAQSAAPERAPETRTPAAPPGNTQTEPGRPPSGSSVIPPPAGVDPGMTKPPPNAEAFPTPIIPPPGTRGGNERVVPK